MTNILFRFKNIGSLEKIRKAFSQHFTATTDVQKASMTDFSIAITDLNDRLQTHLEDYEEHRIERSMAEYRLKREIRTFYRQGYQAGKRMANNFTEESAWDLKELMRLRRDDFKYLRGFLDDIDAGAGKMKYTQRMKMYADALSGPFWLAFAGGNKSSLRRIKWVVNYEAEHCDTCLKLGGRVWTPESFIQWYKKTKILPGENTICLSNCKCHLEEWMLPEAKYDLLTLLTGAGVTTNDAMVSIKIIDQVYNPQKTLSIKEFEDLLTGDIPDKREEVFDITARLSAALPYLVKTSINADATPKTMSIVPGQAFQENKDQYFPILGIMPILIFLSRDKDIAADWARCMLMNYTILNKHTFTRCDLLVDNIRPVTSLESILYKNPVRAQKIWEDALNILRKQGIKIKSIDPKKINAESFKNAKLELYNTS